MDGARGRPVESFLHLHPDWTVRREDAGSGAGDAIFVAEAQGMRVRIEPFGVDDARVVVGQEAPRQGWYCPEFGRAVPSPVLVLTVGSNGGSAFG